MAIIIGREQVEKVVEEFRASAVPMPVFCTASHWNTEAILLAVRRFADRHGVARPAVAVAMTFNYVHMPQAQRVTYSGDARAGFISIMRHLDALCGAADSPYSSVRVLPHLDHADPQMDRWALTDGRTYLATVMFDAQRFPPEENARLTRDYMRAYGPDVLVEGILEELVVADRAPGSGERARTDEAYVERACRYVEETGVDFLVGDLGTEQQSSSVGGASYLGDRARRLTERLGSPLLVLHGTSCLSRAQMEGLAGDGVIRVNMWTRIAREAGQAAAEGIVRRIDAIRQGDFAATESEAYLRESTDHAAGIMEDVLDVLGYARFGR